MSLPIYVRNALENKTYVLDDTYKTIDPKSMGPTLGHFDCIWGSIVDVWMVQHERVYIFVHEYIDIY